MKDGNNEYQNPFERVCRGGLETFSNLNSRVKNKYSVLKNLPEYKDRAKSMGKKALVGGLTFGFLTIPFFNDFSVLADDKKEITVPIGQVIKEKKLSADQMFQDRVTVPMSWVDEDYLEEHGYTKTSEEKTEETEKRDRTLMVEEQDGNLEEYQIDEFRINRFDSDQKVEGVFADNRDEGAYVAPYPVTMNGEDEGDRYKKVFFIPNENVVEIREGNMDKDDQKEFTVFTDENTLSFNLNEKDRKYDIGKYPAPRGEEITDGQIVDGRPFIVTNDENSSSDFELNIYQLEGNKWKPFLSEETREGVLDEISGEFESFHPKNLLMGNWDSDGEYEVIVTDDKDTVYVNDGSLVDFIRGGWNWLGDKQYANYNPSEDKDKEILTIPNTESQEKYNINSSAPYVGILESKKPDGDELFSANDTASGIEQSQKIVTDFQVLPWKFMQPLGAKYLVGSEKWWNSWGGKYNLGPRDTNSALYPFAASTTEKVSSGEGLLDTTGWGFEPEYRESYQMDFDIKKFPDWLKDSKVVKLE